MSLQLKKPQFSRSGDAFGVEAFSQRKRYQLRTDLILFLATDTPCSNEF